MLHIKAEGKLYLAEHPNPHVDLVMIPLLGSNVDAPAGQKISALWSHTILSKLKFDKLSINEGTDVEVIGFSLSSSLRPDASHYHFSRFGKIGLFTTDEFTLLIDSLPKSANFLLLDMIVRPGDSGSPIFAHVGEQTYLIGFVSAQSGRLEYGIGYPVYYLYDLLEILRRRYEAVLRREKLR